MKTLLDAVTKKMNPQQALAVRSAMRLKPGGIVIAEVRNVDFDAVAPFQRMNNAGSRS